MKTTKNVAKKGLFVMVLTLMVMAVFSMTGIDGLSGTNVAQAKANNAPKGANKNDVNALKKLINTQNKYGANIEEDMSNDFYTWKKGRLVGIFLTVKTYYESPDKKYGKGKLDFSKFTKLQNLTVYYLSGITEINVSKNQKLESLTTDADAKRNNLKKLALPKKSKKLKTIGLGVHTKLKHLDVSGLKGLKQIGINCPSFTSLDLSKNKKLESVEFYNNIDSKTHDLKKLKLPKTKTLKSFICRQNKLTSLNLSQYTKLKEIACSGNQIKKLKLPKSKSLTKLECGGNKLTSLDLSQYTKLKEIACEYNQIKELKLPKTKTLEGLHCHENKLSKLDVSGLTSLKSLWCHNNKLSKLDITGLTALQSLSYYGNNLTTDVDTSSCPKVYIVSQS